MIGNVTGEEPTRLNYVLPTLSRHIRNIRLQAKSAKDTGL